MPTDRTQRLPFSSFAGDEHRLEEVGIMGGFERKQVLRYNQEVRRMRWTEELHWHFVEDVKCLGGQDGRQDLDDIGVVCGMLVPACQDELDLCSSDSVAAAALGAQLVEAMDWVAQVHYKVKVIM